MSCTAFEMCSFVALDVVISDRTLSRPMYSSHRLVHFWRICTVSTTLSIILGSTFSRLAYGAASLFPRLPAWLHQLPEQVVEVVDGLVRRVQSDGDIFSAIAW